MKFYIETYGCQMNISDSELVSSILCEAGHIPALDIEAADILIFNTCSVRKHAEDRVLGRISCEKARKLSNPNLKIVVLGCMAQRMGKSLVESGLGVDLVLGVDQYNQLPELLSGLDQNTLTEMNSNEVYDEIIPIHQNPYNAFITIMRGCNNFCTYCIVPHVRGRERSRAFEAIENELVESLESGHLDVTLLGQNVNSYRYNEVDFPSLMARLANRDAKYRLRFITSHPKDLSQELIDVMASHANISKHIHLPMQSGDDNVLKRMNRKYSYSHYRNLIDALRKAMPNIAITTDLIAGFPGETTGQFESTIKAMQDIGFDYAFCFKYSSREGTAAADYSDQVDESERLNRLQHMIDIQREITLNKFRSKIGQDVEIYVESFSRKSKTQVSGKTDDYKIAVVDGDETMLGTFVRAKVVEATAGTLICE